MPLVESREAHTTDEDKPLTSDHKTDQEAFWAGSFGDEYIDRNRSDELLAGNLAFFGGVLARAAGIKSCIEFGPNVGMNLRALKLLFPGIELAAVEINPTAATMLREALPDTNVIDGSFLSFEPTQAYHLSMSCGVLIHINPDALPHAYDALYNSSSRYVLVSEYYSPAPVELGYRGHEGKLFKRDFAGEMLDRFSDLQLIDYGFVYRRDPNFAKDDVNWFLMEKR